MAAKQKVVIPKAVTVAGLTWIIRRKKALKLRGEEVDGLCVPNRQELLLNPVILDKVDRTRKVLIHESTHAGLHAFPQYYDEQLISILENHIDELIRLNPDLMRMYGYERPS